MTQQAHASPSSEAAIHRVLMVEDDASDAERMVGLLGPRSDFALDHVTTLSSTRTRLLEERYDAVLLDLTLPDGEQHEALREIARFAQHIPIVALTGVEDAELAQLCLANGIQDYVHKSELSGVTLARSLDHAISRHRANEMQRRIESAQRQISLGRVAGGVVHEVNNMATVVLSSLEELRARIEGLASTSERERERAVQELLELLDQDIEAMSRMHTLASDLRLFAQREARGTGLLDLNASVTSTLRLLDRRLRLRARVECELGEIPAVEADEAKLGQVLINLLLNAADAIDESPGGEGRIRVETYLERPWVVLSVSDTGCGISREHIDRIFEPFFSSKPLGRGSGLGLSICSELVASWGGKLDVESELHQGSCFRVRLPAAKRYARVSAEPRSPAGGRARRRLRILLIDDMPGPRRAIRRMLDRDHVVVEVGSALDALERLRAGESFDAVICDLMMPDMNGVELCGHVLELDPVLAQRFVLLTGGAFTEDSQAALGDVDLPVLQKPITRAVLLGAIDDIVSLRSEQR